MKLIGALVKRLSKTARGNFRQNFHFLQKHVNGHQIGEVRRRFGKQL